MTGVPSIALAAGPQAARAAIDASPAAVVEISRPPLDDLPYRAFVRAVLARAGGFRLDFNRLTPDAALAMVSDQLFGPAAFVAERRAFAQDIATLAAFSAGIVQGRASVSLRTYFAPGDTVWHRDRVGDAAAVRLLWPIGRPAGMQVAPDGAIDAAPHAGFMRREHPLLGRLDTAVLRTGAAPETLWAHRPEQLAAMMSGRFPFVLRPELIRTITPGAASIHRVATPVQPGTFHRSDWANRHAPGLQLVITAVAETR